MSLWSKDSMRDVLKNLIDRLSEAWVQVGQYWRVPCKSAITQARQRLGARVQYLCQNKRLQKFWQKWQNDPYISV